MTIIVYLVLSFFNACVLATATLLISAWIGNTHTTLIALVVGAVTFVASFVVLACCRVGGNGAQ